MEKVKINSMTLKTPSEDILIKSKVDEYSVLSIDEYTELMKEWDEILNKGTFFKLPVEGGKIYGLPKYTLERSYLILDVECLD